MKVKRSDYDAYRRHSSGGGAEHSAVLIHKTGLGEFSRNGRFSAEYPSAERAGGIGDSAREKERSTQNRFRRAFGRPAEVALSTLLYTVKL